MAEPNSGRLTLIHLANSSSQPVVWLLEELGVDYELRAFDRKGTAPPELKNTHPQGKAPQLILANGRVITQLSAITMYLINTYDKGHTFRGEENDPVHEEQLVCIGVSDLSGKVGAKFMFHGMAVMSPFFIRPLLNTVRSKINNLLFNPDITAAFNVLETDLGEKEWFLGGQAPSRADFVLHFFVDLAVQPKYVDFEKYPNLKRWKSRCEARPAWKRSLEKGNGYDLDFPSQW